MVIKLARFVPLLKKRSHLLDNFDDFTKELQSCFGDTNSVRIAINKIRRLREGNPPASAYVAEIKMWNWRNTMFATILFFMR